MRLDEAAVEVINFRRCVIWISPGSCNKTQFTCMPFSYPFFMWHILYVKARKTALNLDRAGDEIVKVRRLECSIFLFYFPLLVLDTLHSVYPCLLMTLCCMKCWDVNAVKYKVVLGTTVNYIIGRIFHGSEMVFVVADDTTEVID